MDAVAKLASYLSRTLAVIAGIALLTIMVATCFDVVLRHSTGRGFAQAVEYSEVLLVIMVFLAWSEAQRRGVHVSVDLLFARLSPSAQQVIAIAGTVLVLALLIPITWKTGVNALTSYQTGEFRIGVSDTPIWPARAAVTVGLLAAVVGLLAQLAQLFAGRTLDEITQEGETAPTL